MQKEVNYIPQWAAKDIIIQLLKGERIIMVKFKNYTEEQIQYIKDNYVNLETKEIATKLNITPTKVSYIANKLGLKNNHMLNGQKNNWIS